jgi:AcrR family transcriptional regulator
MAWHLKGPQRDDLPRDPRPPARREPVDTRAMGRKGRARRSAILDVAERVFGMKGMTAGRIEDVAEEAGVAKSLVFSYWPTRDALYEEVLYRVSERYRGWVERAVSQPGPGDQLQTTVAAALSFFDTYTEVGALFKPLLSESPPETRQPEIEALDEVLATWSTSIWPEAPANHHSRASEPCRARPGSQPRPRSASEAMTGNDGSSGTSSPSGTNQAAARP